MSQTVHCPVKMDFFQHFSSFWCWYILCLFTILLHTNCLFTFFCFGIWSDWQQYLLDWFYAVPKFRQRIYRAIFEQNSQKLLSNPSQQLLSTSKLTFSLALARSAIIDVTVDDDLNVFALALLSGKPHVMSCSLFTRVSSKYYRDENFDDFWGIHRIKSKDCCQHSLQFLSVFLT